DRQGDPSGPGRRTRRPENLESVLPGDRDQAPHVRMTLERRWQDAFGGGLTDLPQESFELHRREADQRSGPACLRVERVWNALRPECKRTGFQGVSGVGDPDRHLALEDVEPLVL